MQRGRRGEGELGDGERDGHLAVGGMCLALVVLVPHFDELRRRRFPERLAELH